MIDINKLKITFSYFIILGVVSTSFAFQTKKTDDVTIKAINNYIDFVNESTHGMLIVNKLLENYNLDINKYVDLESQKINNYTNKDLPMDVFQDPDRMFFNNFTPFELYDKSIKGSQALPTNLALSLNDLANKLKTQITLINNLRFELDKLTVGVDLSKKENLAKVYEQLEVGAKAFENFYTYSVEIETTTAVYYNAAKNSKWNDLFSTYSLARAMLKSVRAKNTEELPELQSKYKLALEKLKKASLDKQSLLNQLGRHSQAIITNGEDIDKAVTAFINNDAVPDNYKLYGRYYYYHNVGLISKFNRYGTGLASEVNAAIDMTNQTVLHAMEMPHIYQVIYPRKLEDTTKIISKDNNVAALPAKLRERTIARTEYTIKADSIDIELLLYDHMLQDGDIVSINFNGDWILEKAEIERKPQVVKLHLNPLGKNYIVLHAESVGTRPPNTMAISYKYKGIKREIVLKSDYNTSEMIEITLDN